MEAARDSRRGVGRDAPVRQPHHALAPPGQRLVMGDDHQRRSAGLRALEQQFDDVRASRRVEIARRLVREDERRIGGERAGYGDALLLSARKLRGIVPGPMTQPNCVQFGLRAGEGIVRARQFQRGGDVFQRGHCGQQVKRLQHDADAAPPRAGERILVQRGEILSRHLQRAAGGAFQPGQHGHQRAFPAARRAQQRERLSLRHGEVDSLQDGRVAEGQSEATRVDGMRGERRLCHVPRDRRRGPLRQGAPLARAGARRISRGMRTATTMAALAAIVMPLAACSEADAPERALEAAAPEASAPDSPERAATPVTGPERRILAFGDSLFAGYRLDADEAYPARLEAAMRARGINARIANAGVSGDTTAAGLQRFEFTLDAQETPPEMVVIELGANDLLRGLPVEAARDNLASMIEIAQQRGIDVLLVALAAPPNLGPELQARFDGVYTGLAEEYRVPLVTGFMRPLYGRTDLVQADRLHPTAEGVEVLVDSTVEQVVEALPERAD